MPPVDRDKILVAKGWHRDIVLRPPILKRLGLRELHRSARIAILLAQLGGRFGPALGNSPARIIRRGRAALAQPPATRTDAAQPL